LSQEAARRNKLALREAGQNHFDKNEIKLLQIASRLAAMEEAEQAARDEQLGDTILASVITQARQEF
jgi:hypothetical protein